jgi:hypothetical protein
MSITGAVKELNKEIERLTKLRDALLEGSPEAAVSRCDWTKTWISEEIRCLEKVLSSSSAQEEDALRSWPEADLGCCKSTVGRNEVSYGG